MRLDDPARFEHLVGGDLNSVDQPHVELGIATLHVQVVVAIAGVGDDRARLQRGLLPVRLGSVGPHPMEGESRDERANRGWLRDEPL